MSKRFRILIGLIAISSMVLVSGLVTSAPANAINRVGCDLGQYLWLLRAKKDPSDPPTTYGTCFTNSGTMKVYAPNIVTIGAGFNSGILNITTGQGFVEFARNEYFNIAPTTVTQVRIY